MAALIKVPLGMEVDIGPGDFVLDWDPTPHPNRGSRQFFVYCGQTAGWIKMAVGTDVGLGPGHIVLDGDPGPLPKKGRAPSFLPDVC